MNTFVSKSDHLEHFGAISEPSEPFCIFRLLRRVKRLALRRAQRCAEVLPLEALA